ncbi:MAG TPA: BNR repeat-containing protein [Flavisolibacter sp.]
MGVRHRITIKACILLLCFFGCLLLNAQELIPVGLGWARNSINTVVFRKHSLASFKDTQFIAFYNADSYVVIAKRSLQSNQWQLKQTPYKGKTTDAHNSISIAVDGDGYLHMAWDHHGSKLRYCKSTLPGGLELTEGLPMMSDLERNVSYPEFYNLPNGDLLFFYRDGSSGSGNMVINRYDTKSKTWTRLHRNLIDGEKIRNAYWQAYVDAKGTVHLSWVWRESPNVASNHDLCYAKSEDGGITWKKSTGEQYSLPITAANAEYACKIPQGSELINQTSMTADEKGRPYIASYWRDSGSAVPQYQLLYNTGKTWKKQNAGFRKTPFSLSGAGTKRIPISRPQVIVWNENGNIATGIIFRDEERGNKISVAVNSNIEKRSWSLLDLTNENLGSWEPTFDIDLWKRKGELHLFVQKTEQADGEGISTLQPQTISVLQWKPKKRKK